MKRDRALYVNEAYRPQRISGQQRYATEISDRLGGDVRRVAPGRFWSASALRTWVWVQTILPARTWRGVLISLTARSPVWHPRHVMVVHDLFVIEHPEWFSRKFHLTHAPLFRVQLWNARSLVAVSEPVAAQLRARRASSEVVVAPNAPSPVFSAEHIRGTRPEEVLSDLGLLARGYILVVGNLDPRKNLARLAAAYGRLDPEQRVAIPLVVVGGGADVFRQADIQWPQEALLTGYLQDEALGALYANSLAVVFPSLAEGFGLPIVEAISAGAPALLVSDIPVFRWICGDGAAFVDPTSIDELASALRAENLALIPAPDEAAALRFNWERSARVVQDAANVVGR